MATTRTVTLLFGGKSSEHDVSKRSAAFVWKNLDHDAYPTVAIGISRQGEWYKQQFDFSADAAPAPLPLIETKQQLVDPISYLSEKKPVVFSVLHGSYGENGAMQSLFEMCGAAFVGSDRLGSSIGMDKTISRRLAEFSGVPCVPYVELSYDAYHKRPDEFLERCEKKFSFPMFVKPCCEGSSVGVKKVKKDRAELDAAIRHAFTFDRRVLVELAIDAREIECGILGGDAARASTVGEINVSGAEFYDYEAKYISATAAEIIIPAKIDRELTEKVQAMSLRIFEALRLYGLARVDFFLCRKTGGLYFNEVNTLPGFTSISQYPMLWQHSGLSGKSLVAELLELALRR